MSPLLIALIAVAIASPFLIIIGFGIAIWFHNRSISREQEQFEQIASDEQAVSKIYYPQNIEELRKMSFDPPSYGKKLKI